VGVLHVKVGGTWIPIAGEGGTPITGPAGPQGPPGPTAVSADARNTAIISPTDSLIYVGPTAWTALPIGPNIAAHTGTAQPPQYRLEGDVVRVRGWFSRTTGNLVNGDLLGTLPVGFRPPFSLEYAVSYSGQMSIIGVGPDGTLTCLFPTAAATACTLALTFAVT